MAFNLIDTVAGGVSKAANALPFDPTPGFNLRRPGQPSKGWGPGGGGLIGPTGGGIPKDTGGGDYNFRYAQGLKKVPTDGEGGGGSGGGGSSAQDQQEKSNLLAQLAQQEQDINQALGRLGKQRKIGERNISSGYNRNLNRLNRQKAIGERDFETNMQDVTQDFSANRNQVNTDTRARLQSLLQLLGSQGSGVSSAAQTAAPFAATREGTQRLQPIQRTFAVNKRNLDTQLDDFLDNFQESREDLSLQRRQNRNKLLSEIKGQRVSLLDKLNAIGLDRARANDGSVEGALAAQANRRRQIANLLDQIVGLGSQFGGRIKARNIAFDAPDLADFELDDPAAIETDFPGAGDIDPSLRPILAEEEEDLENLV